MRYSFSANLPPMLALRMPAAYNVDATEKWRKSLFLKRFPRNIPDSTLQVQWAGIRCSDRHGYVIGVFWLASSSESIEWDSRLGSTSESRKPRITVTRRPCGLRDTCPHDANATRWARLRCTFRRLGGPGLGASPRRLVHAEVARPRKRSWLTLGWGSPTRNLAAPFQQLPALIRLSRTAWRPQGWLAE